MKKTNSMKKTSSMSKEGSNLRKSHFGYYFCCGLVNFKNFIILFWNIWVIYGSWKTWGSAVFDSKCGRVQNMQELLRVLNMPQYGWKCLNKMWICLNMSEFTITESALNMSHTMHSAWSLYKLMSAFWDCQKSKI